MGQNTQKELIRAIKKDDLEAVEFLLNETDTSLLHRSVPILQATLDKASDTVFNQMLDWGFCFDTFSALEGHIELLKSPPDTLRYKRVKAFIIHPHTTLPSVWATLKYHKLEKHLDNELVELITYKLKEQELDDARMRYYFAKQFVDAYPKKISDIEDDLAKMAEDTSLGLKFNEKRKKQRAEHPNHPGQNVKARTPLDI